MLRERALRVAVNHLGLAAPAVPALSAPVARAAITVLAEISPAGLNRIRANPTWLSEATVAERGLAKVFEGTKRVFRLTPELFCRAAGLGHVALADQFSWVLVERHSNRAPALVYGDLLVKGLESEDSPLAMALMRGDLPALRWMVDSFHLGTLAGTEGEELNGMFAERVVHYARTPELAKEVLRLARLDPKAASAALFRDSVYSDGLFGWIVTHYPLGLDFWRNSWFVFGDFLAGPAIKHMAALVWLFDDLGLTRSGLANNHARNWEHRVLDQALGGRSLRILRYLLDRLKITLGELAQRVFKPRPEPLVVDPEIAAWLSEKFGFDSAQLAVAPAEMEQPQIHLTEPDQAETAGPAQEPPPLRPPARGRD